MAKKQAVGIRGGPELQRALQRLEKGLGDDAVKAATLAAAEILAEAWRERVESSIGRGPGVAHYADAIKAYARKGKKGATGLVQLRPMAVSEGEAHPREYAKSYEFGSGRRSRPTLRPAYDASEQQMLDAMSDELRRLIEAAT